MTPDNASMRKAIVTSSGTVVALFLLLAVISYIYLIWKSCETTSLNDFFRNFKAFHTSKGC